MSELIKSIAPMAETIAPYGECIFNVASRVIEFGMEKYADHITEEASSELNGLLPHLIAQLSTEIACGLTDCLEEQISILDNKFTTLFAECTGFRVLVGLLNCRFDFTHTQDGLNYTQVVNQIVRFVTETEISQNLLSIGHKKLEITPYFKTFLAGNECYHKVIEGMPSENDLQSAEKGLLTLYSKQDQQ